jgi:hypothetical protein
VREDELVSERKRGRESSAGARARESERDERAERERERRESGKGGRETERGPLTIMSIEPSFGTMHT